MSLFYYLYGCENTKNMPKINLIKKKTIKCNTFLCSCFLPDMVKATDRLLFYSTIDESKPKKIKKKCSKLCATYIRLATGISELSLKVGKKRFAHSTVI